MENDVPDELYYDGLKEGIKRFAWWKDGIQYVGTTGKTLSQALEQVDREKAEGRMLKYRDP